jgi:uncharacterized membrane protein YphA (DoxX/SURF4 family)
MLANYQPINKILKSLVGLVFIFSGIVKLNDPVGFSWTLEAYWKTFAADFTPLFLKLLPFSLGLAIAIATLELVLGVALLVSFRIRLTLVALLLLTAFFTGLTFYTALFKRLGSCGCFGDAIPLTPWQSFIKSNLLLLVLYGLYQRRDNLKSSLGSSMQLGIVLLAGVGGVMIGWYTWQHLPILDFSPYKRDSNLVHLYQPNVLLRYQYILEKDGQRLESLTYPDDPTYQLVETKLLNPKAKPKITNFTIWDEQQEITAEILQGTKLLIIVQHPTQLAPSTYKLLATFLQELTDMVQPIWLLPFHERKTSVPDYLATSLAWASPDFLKTMLKAKFGLVLIQEGRIVGKWAYRDLEKVKKLLVQQNLLNPKT